MGPYVGVEQGEYLSIDRQTNKGLVDLHRVDRYLSGRTCARGSRG